MNASVKNQIAYLRSTKTIRAHCSQLYFLGQRGLLKHFHLHEEKIEDAANYVLEEIKTNYPTLEIPYHSRWRHFEVDDEIHSMEYFDSISGLNTEDQGKSMFELAILSVLLDAGAGSMWKYREDDSRKTYTRSEGLAIASLVMFRKGMFSSNHTHNQADALGLLNMRESGLALGLQHDPAINPILGLEGRLSLLNKLGEVLLHNRQFFGNTSSPRLGEFFSYCLQFAKINNPEKPSLPADQLLAWVLEIFTPIWPSRLKLGGEPLGDVWKHSQVEGDMETGNHIPFHKLSQWLTYSLLEPLEKAGVQITDLTNLTGLPEYRNGGLFLDLGVLSCKEPNVLGKSFSPSDETIVEWRALTVCLLDILWENIRKKLHKDQESFPLARVLQGGSWSAGRKIAKTLRPPEGNPPIQLQSDGTVF